MFKVLVEGMLGWNISFGVILSFVYGTKIVFFLYLFSKYWVRFCVECFGGYDLVVAFWGRLFSGGDRYN